MHPLSLNEFFPNFFKNISASFFSGEGPESNLEIRSHFKFFNFAIAAGQRFESLQVETLQLYRESVISNTSTL